MPVNTTTPPWTISAEALNLPEDAAFPRSNYINGRKRTDGNGRFNTVTDKYHGTAMAHVPLATAAQMDEAISAAVAARPALRRMSAGERSRNLAHLAHAIEENADVFARTIMQEAGKPIGYAEAEVARALVTVRTAAAEALRLTGEQVAMDFGKGIGRTAITKRIPIGVVAAITPFNFPLNLVLHKVAPALASGCPVVLKPAPQTPLTSLLLAELIDGVGWPAGAFNVLVATNEVAEVLVRDERVAMLSFTGSDAVGWRLKEMCGKKKVALELGGNAAVVIDEGTDLAAAARNVAMGANLYAGQTCISTQRIFVVKSVFDPFRDLLVKEFHALRAGDPADRDVAVGPLIDRKHFRRIADWLDEAIKGGARLLAGGKPVDTEHNVFAATLLTGTKLDMKVFSEEMFGPITLVEPVRDFSEAIAQVNNSRYGLQAAVYTNNLAHMKQAHAELEVGTVVINDIPGFRIDSMPYGGVKDSGLGREGLRYAMEEMTEPRLMVY
ncbi:MAG TPA: aldehyde dehydrogenase family protein [Flavobacteriales bacterium]|nr:aldehyde dehydrogenase family protein [Flavobacteriales bacterium]HRP81557.1 aldehyde dehydrogenase family protein [Flavobacteriales bacterium]HRQ84766.1 aldehyde dehydrogenase family protein [Flavobacteriales bacterium]